MTVLGKILIKFSNIINLVSYGYLLLKLKNYNLKNPANDLASAGFFSLD